ncbi:NnrU family protein [Alterinioella nitratireducens]|jgi:uncharacterized membrane protein|uniref:NnrU family protein n=1 Tax=Alterinioella nitratireducens TaxID=2735915 RepID=UPI000C93D6F6|nr:hypothetical protein [Dinoroseobacter sp.]|tara:strand:- start:449 stop:1003 length:555 start_codon:yes stop_codon:yes gene_type:complete
MSLILLLAGLALWAGAHFFKRIAPDARARMGQGGKGVIALALVGAIVLMVIGYRGMDFIPVWSPPPFLTHVNNLLVLIALYLFAAGDTKASLTARMRHPMLAGMKTWAIAHLLVNGDLASIILFGGLLAWAVAEVIVINRSEPGWKGRENTSLKGDAMAAVGALVLFVVIGYIHSWLGPWPFGG